MLTLLETLQKQARDEPDRTYASYALSTDVSEGFRDVTVGDLVRAIDAFAWWLHAGWGRSEDFGTVAYIGPSDLRYAIFFYAAIKCGYKTLFISPLNSFEASKSILEATKCQRIFYAPPMGQVAKTLQSAAESRKTEIIQIASLDECLAAESNPYPYEKTFEEAKWDPIVVLHTSGTTGLPKPITMNFGFFSTTAEPVPAVPGYKDGSFKWFERRTFFGPFPPFHLGGIYSMMTIPVYFDATIIIPPAAPGAISGKALVGIMHRKKIEAMFCSPLSIEQAMHEPGGREKLREMHFIAFAGAPLPSWVGDDLSKHTIIMTFFGSTETGAMPTIPPHPDDWAYIKFNPCVGAVLEPMPTTFPFPSSSSSSTSISSSTTSSTNPPPPPPTTPHELVFPPTTDQAILRHRGNAWLSLPPETTANSEWRSRDLFVPHPDPDKAREGFWRFHGRVDDVVELASGARFFPAPWEAVVRGHARVAHCMVVGAGRGRAGVLVEPKEGWVEEGEGEVDGTVAAVNGGGGGVGEEGRRKREEEEERFMDEVWPAIERANEGVAEYARVAREMVRVVRPGSLFRAPKGTVIRRASGDGHREIIEEMYRG
ncbi:Histone transcription regulator 3 [Diplodia seriata]|uniref:Histone transcription regulator 3 n=1 Tax=Diplodia seriata TaxID=420778 RepID=A0ABR3CM27_9PEZI